MKLYVTEIKAIDPQTGHLVTWSGPNVPGISFATAREYCQTNGLGYCKVIGQLVTEIPCDENMKPDWNNMIDYEKATNN